MLLIIRTEELCNFMSWISGNYLSLELHFYPGFWSSQTFTIYLQVNACRAVGNPLTNVTAFQTRITSACFDRPRFPRIAVLSSFPSSKTKDACAPRNGLIVFGLQFSWNKQDLENSNQWRLLCVMDCSVLLLVASKRFQRLLQLFQFTYLTWHIFNFLFVLLDVCRLFIPCLS